MLGFGFGIGCCLPVCAWQGTGFIEIFQGWMIMMGHHIRLHRESAKHK